MLLNKIEWKRCSDACEWGEIPHKGIIFKKLGGQVPHYDIYIPGCSDSWRGLDPVTAQSVLYHLTRLSPKMRLSPNRKPSA
jgi:hypothetical protein